MKISLLTPTRGRPHAMQRLWESAWNTADDKTNLEVVFYMDNDDAHSLDQFQKMDSPQHLGICGNRIVLSQMWNECSKIATGEILMHCFPAGELVMTVDGPRPIESIKIGDFVMVGDGTLRPVVKLFERKFQGAIHTIKATGMPPVQVTGNHEIFTSIGSWKKKRKLSEPKKEKASELGRNHFTIHPIPQDCGILAPDHATETYCKLAGWYLSEGSIYEGDSTTRMSFDLHIKETSYSEEIQSLLIELMSAGFNSPKNSMPRTSVQGNCLRTWFSSDLLSEKLIVDFGKFAHGKTIPSWIMFGDIKKSKHLLRGMWLGDGHLPKMRSWHFTTVSVDLGYGMKQLLARHGIASTLEIRDAYVDKRGTKHRKTYRVYVSEELSKQKLAQLLDIQHIPSCQKKHKNSFPVVERVVYHRVQKNNKKHVECDEGVSVFNIQVQDKHEYVVSSGLVANCGDDIIFRSQGWDTLVRGHIGSYPDKIVFVHGMDGIQNEKLGTHGFLHRNWMDVTGYFVPPYFSCDYNDTWLTDVSDMIGRRIYEPRIYTEHMHWAVGKQPRDQTYTDTAARGHRDNVTAMYNSMLPKRQEDAKKLREFIEKVKQG